MPMTEFKKYSAALRTIGQNHSAEMFDRLIKIIEEQQERLEKMEKSKICSNSSCKRIKND